MEIDAVLTAIQTRLKAYLATAFGDRVFIVPSRVAVPTSYQMPYVGIIFKGGDPDSNMFGGINYYDVEIIIFQTIVNEEFTVIGTPADSGQNRGLTGLLSDVVGALKNYELPSPVSSGNSTPIAVTSYIGTENWISDLAGYSASIGINIRIGVSYGN